MLSEEERELVALKRQGCTNKQAAQELDITLWAVKGRLACLYRRFEVHTAGQLLDALRKEGLVEATDSSELEVRFKKREALIAPHIVAGLKNADIAEQTGLTERRVISTVHSMLARYRCANRVELAEFLAQHGF